MTKAGEIRMKKFVCLCMAVLMALMCVPAALAEDSVIAQANANTNVPFSNGYYGFCLDRDRYKSFLDIELRNKSDIMSDKDLGAALLLANVIEKDISNDLVHYAGGSPEIDGFKENVQYSLSNNVYGVYDLLTSENEITKNSKVNEEGRFRLVLKSIN